MVIININFGLVVNLLVLKTNYIYKIISVNSRKAKVTKGIIVGS